MNTKPVFRKQILGVREAETFRCGVLGCGLDCGDQGTLARHLGRAHPELVSNGDPATLGDEGHAGTLPTPARGAGGGGE